MGRKTWRKLERHVDMKMIRWIGKYKRKVEGQRIKLEINECRWSKRVEERKR